MKQAAILAFAILIIPFALLGIGNLLPLSLSSLLNTPAAQTVPSPLVTATSSVSPLSAETPTVLGTSTTEDFSSEKVVALVNAYRQEQGRTSLRNSGQLNAAAQLLAQARLGEPTLAGMDEQSIIALAGQPLAELAILEVAGRPTPWKLLEAWQADAKYALLLVAPHFTQIGISQWCQPSTEATTTERCSTIAVFGN